MAVREKRTILTGVMMSPSERQELEDLAKAANLNLSDTIRYALGMMQYEFIEKAKRGATR